MGGSSDDDDEVLLLPLPLFLPLVAMLGIAGGKGNHGQAVLNRVKNRDDEVSSERNKRRSETVVARIPCTQHETRISTWN
jgi:hypothetical protein